MRVRRREFCDFEQKGTGFLEPPLFERLPSRREKAIGLRGRGGPDAWNQQYRGGQDPATNLHCNQKANFNPSSITRESFCMLVMRPKVGEDCVPFGFARLGWLNMLKNEG